MFFEPGHRQALALGIKPEELSKLASALKVQLLLNTEVVSQPLSAPLQAAVPSEVTAA